VEDINTYENNSLILVDSHIHINNCYDLKYFFDSAFNNFSHFNDQLTKSKKFTGVLFLTEAGDYNFFKKFYDNSKTFSTKLNYKLKQTSEDNSLIISNGENNIVLVAGQQIVTAENIEVLALGTINRFKYGNSISDTIDQINKTGAISVVPWGVGKWIGRRENVVKQLISSRSDFFLGDNGNRPAFWGLPSLFKIAESKGIYNLPGSDPLSFETEMTKPGSFGFFFKERIDLNYPVNYLKKKILSADKQFDSYGRLENPVKFFRNQINIQINKKLRKL